MSTVGSDLAQMLDLAWVRSQFQGVRCTLSRVTIKGDIGNEHSGLGSGPDAGSGVGAFAVSIARIADKRADGSLFGRPCGYPGAQPGHCRDPELSNEFQRQYARSLLDQSA